ncbi:MAG: hypothetical protein NT123_24425 [Proteobacteria bacterium]|nr:hypothetical protein [Pseudomonadota bacterium]
MAIFQAVNGKLVPIESTTFSEAGFKERADLQQLLKQQIEVIAPETLIISEEFGSWEDSRRRIDLLGLDKEANLVVIELKRTEDGGHMELQALRYAAMVSALTFDEAVVAFELYLSSIGDESDARARILDFLEWDEPDVEEFPKDVRLILASAEFSKEITTTVLWLNDHGLDVKCVRLRPYNDSGRLLIDVQQVIPLPEAENYQIRIRDKKVVERAARTQNRDLTRYDVTVGEVSFTNLPKRRAVYQVIRKLCDDGIDPEEVISELDFKGDALIQVVGELDAAAFEEALAALLTAQGKKPNTLRYFTANDELIHAQGKTYAVTKMWGPKTTRAIDALLKRFPGHKISYHESS